MAKGNVGAGILDIITQSLYDKPIVVFREYIQNSVDAFRKIEKQGVSDELYCKAWYIDNSLCFLDNGTGISEKSFLNKMKIIAYTEKDRIGNIGYKGIGRLSGLPYCDELTFINIISYKKDIYQKYTIDNLKYKSLKNSLNEYEYSEIIDLIGNYSGLIKNDCEVREIKKIIDMHDIFVKQDTGFLVILNNINKVLNRVIEQRIKLFKELGWLLPVKFNDELFNDEYKYLFKELTEPFREAKIVPAKSYNISFNNKEIERPLRLSMLRDCVCKRDFKYGIGFHSFNTDKILITKTNEFSGIKLYIDNMFLCDESELIPLLLTYGLIEHTENELIQSVRAVGVIIYITDKVNISTNARRTFIEIADNYAIEFLHYIADFVEEIYKARYDLSRYRGKQNSINADEDELEKLRTAAENSIRRLASEKVEIDTLEWKKPDFNELEDIDKKREVKNILMKNISDKIKDYIFQTDSFDYGNIVDDFITWLINNN